MEHSLISARMTELNIYEALRYLGYQGQELTPELMEQVKHCMDQVARISVPRLVYRIVDMPPKRSPQLQGGEPMFEQLAHASFLQGCEKLVLMAVTLGPEVERLLMRREVTDMAEAVIMDACAGVAIENVCAGFEEDLRGQVEAQGLFLTDRYSPGYEELELGIQQEWCTFLNTARRIGLTVTENHLLIPRKSVTAVMGISPEKTTRRLRGCAVCSLSAICSYKMTGRACS